MIQVLLVATLLGKTIWMDVDPAVLEGGHEPDDGLALLQAFNSPEIDVKGISVVFGNSPLTVGYPNAKEIAKRFGPKNIPVYKGAANRHELGTKTDASAALSRALEKEPLTILALGPVTNVATMLMNNPKLRGRVNEIVAVAGRRPGQQFLLGNGDTPLRDFNFESDAPAMQVLLQSGVPITLAPFEISSKTPLTKPDIERFSKHPKLADFYLQPLRDRIKRFKERFNAPAVFPFDTLAVAYITSPHWISCAKLPVEIQTLPDDIQPNQNKPYLIVSSEIVTPIKVNYCHTASHEFVPDLMRRFLRK